MIVAAACTTFGEGAGPSDAMPDAAVDGTVGASEAGPVVDAGETRSCAWLPRGTTTPCRGCLLSTVVDGLAPEAKYVFAIAVDATSMYYATDGNRGGDSALGRIFRKDLADPKTPPVLVAYTAGGAARSLVVLGGDIVFATRRRVSRVPSTCGGTCTPETVHDAGNDTVHGMVKRGDGVVIATSTGLVTTSPAGRLPYATSGSSAVALFRDEVASVREHADAVSTGALFPSGDSFPLLQAPPVGDAGKSKGGAFVGATCAGLFTVQFYEGATVPPSLAFSVPGEAAPRVALPTVNTFAIAGDATHVYLAQPDRTNGVLRVAPNGDNKALASAIDVWAVAVTDDHVYFDDHAAGAIYRVKKED